MKSKKLNLESKIPRKIYKELASAIVALDKFKKDGIRENYFSEDQTKKHIKDLQWLIKHYDSELQSLNNKKAFLLKIIDNTVEVNEKRRLETIKSLKREIVQLEYFLKNGKRKMYKNIENSYYYRYICNSCFHKEWGLKPPPSNKCAKCNSIIAYEGRIPKEWKPSFSFWLG